MPATTTSSQEAPILEGAEMAENADTQQVKRLPMPKYAMVWPTTEDKPQPYDEADYMAHLRDAVPPRSEASEG